MIRTNLRITLFKIIILYCFFYAVVKVIGIWKGMWLIPNLIVVITLVIVGITGIWLTRQKNYPLIYVMAGSFFIILLRVYETRWVLYLNQYFN
ncbi:MAG: hypothetical protein CO119_00615 [Flavobacteriales bacterium CG_4_9_14_3_um_filter_40_17]|nr:MAG: hypothetical protein CO119_00615 [Flavobacteriales bacterium CG_4_9_14_3_um_filter_40_17]